MRVLITSTPGTGHVYPLVPIATALRSAGHQLLWAVAEDGADDVRRFAFDVASAGMRVDDRLAALAPRLPEIMSEPPRARRKLLFSGLFASIAAPAMVTDLEPVFDSFRPDVVIHETAELASAPLAAAGGIPHATVAFSGALSGEAIQLTSDAMSPVWHDVGLPTPTYADICGDIMFHPFPPSLGQVPNASRVEMMRPELVSAVDDGVPTWLDGFGRDRPGVYVTAGTTVRAASSQAPWPQILEALASLDIDVIATMGPSVDIARLTHPPPNVRVARYVPQRYLLDRVAVVVSHGGAGTMLGAALHGRPQLVIPTFADQWENADAIVGSGAAILSEPEDRTAEAIAIAIGRLLREPSFGIAARRVADEIAVMPTAADHVSTIEALVHTAT